MKHSYSALRRWLACRTPISKPVFTWLCTILYLSFVLASSASAQTVINPEDTDPGYAARKAQAVRPQLASGQGQRQVVTPATPHARPACFEAVDSSATGNAVLLPRNDDGSFGPVALGFNFSLFGTLYNQAYINTNGNITFDAAYGEYNASGFPIGVPMVAPFWADVDTRNTSSGRVSYALYADRLVVTWNRVAYFTPNGGGPIDKKNTFQVVIRANTAPTFTGNDVSFAYDDMQWTTGNASGGASGLGGTPATVGANRGNNVDFIQTGRFNLAGAQAPNVPTVGTPGGIDFLDQQCLGYQVRGSGNVPPAVAGLPANNTLTVPFGQTVTASLQFSGPETNQTVNVTSNLGGLCNTTAPVTGNNTANPTVNLSVTGAACNVGTRTITFTALDNGTPLAAQSTFTLTVIVSPPLGPTLTSLSALGGAVGTSITLTGANLTGATAVRFNGTAATTFAVVNATTITATVPAGATSGPVTVTTPSGTSNGLAFAVLTTPTVVTLAPANITTTSATLGATLTSDGGLLSGTTSYGYVYVQGTGTPSTSNFLGNDGRNITAPAALPASFTSVVSTLLPGTTYTVRALVVNSLGTFYGSAITFTTTTTCTAPVLTVPANQTLAADAGQCSATRTFAASATGTPAPTLSYTVNGTPIIFPYAFPVGTTTVTVTATNSCSTATGTFTVTVQDQQAPTLRAAGFITAIESNGTRTIEAADVDWSSFDNCSGIASMTISPRTFTCANIGPNQVTLTVTDNAGNSASETVTVFIVDNTAPTLRVAGFQTRLENGTRTIYPVDIDYGSFDNCGLAAVTISPSTFTCANVGTNPVTVTVRDNAGNVATQTVNVIILADATCSSSVASRSNAAGASLSNESQLQAYPNPVTDQATVSFRPTQAGLAQVRVYNPLGVLVATLYDGQVDAGRLYRVTLNGQPLANGVYNCQLITNGTLTNQRLLVSK
ncbi:nidogen-like domain-containing protein [Hymenobacter norwichensis]|uniref:nidogen-like domain-containing protein n=1 Tax=Hymenobacter norwichensis TaxID=223903 RepID=UPI0003B344DF|nr:nidogen-like domain-containing protein [Hymenobacter norwichensis]